MNYFLGMLLGYIIHDALQPTAIGQMLDKVALPADLFVAGEKENDQIMV